MSRWTLLALLGVLGVAMRAGAQTGPPDNPWSRGTTIDGFAGIGVAGSNAGALAGAALGWEITPRFGLDGKVAWLDRPGSDEAVAAALTAHATLTRPGTIVPFVKGGIALYRIDLHSERDDLPEFYRLRLGVGIPGLATRRVFTDPAFVIGGGIDLYATRQIAVGPDVEAIIVRHGGRSHVVTVVALAVSYHFEEHPITPRRRVR